MSLSVVLPTSLLMSVPGVELSTYIRAEDSTSIVDALKEGDKFYLDYLIKPEFLIKFPGQEPRTVEFSDDYFFTYLVYRSGSPISQYLSKLCTDNGVEFDEV
jgi:hypothetical protein